MYRARIITTMGSPVEHIFRNLSGGGVQSFPNVEENQGSERAAYLEWVAEGNTPEPWPPAE